MLPIVKHKGTVIPLDRSNVDTDAIIPKQFLKSIKSQVLDLIYLMSGATLIKESQGRM